MIRFERPATVAWRMAELFALANLAFLALDVWLAHAVNAFERRPEWIPVLFSLAAPVVLVIAALAGGITPSAGYPIPSEGAPLRRALARWLGLLIGWASLAVGVAGMIYHLQSHFFEEQTLRNLVYTAPFIAPLAYSGIGMLLILDRMVDSESLEWAQWVVFLALGGFGGNFVLSLADHAQNGFFNRLEWLPVIASALAVAFLLLALARPADRLLRVTTGWLMAVEAAVGAAGFALHVRANFAAAGDDLWQKFIFGAPAFAPLLFANLALLAGIGLWRMADARASE